MEKKAKPKALKIAAPSGVWGSIAQDSAIKEWTADLSRLMKLPYSLPDWAIAGHGVMIEAQEEADARDLIHRVAGEAGMALHILDSNGVIGNFPQWFDSLVAGEPAIVYMGAGPWQGEKFAEKHPNAPHSQFDEEQCRQFRAELKSLMADKLPGELIILVTVISSVQQMDVSLRSAGLFDRRIQMPKIPDEGLAAAFIEEIGRENCGPTILEQASKVGCLLKHEYPDRRRRLLMQKAMQRLSWRHSRLLTFDDMVRFASYGTSDMDTELHDPEQMRRAAIHEAGHALVSHMNSRHQTPPEYCSILPRDETHGIVVSAFDGYERNNNDLSYRDMAYKIRVMLAGRAAEHLILGSEEVSAKGASSDLENATEISHSMLGLWGLSDVQGCDSMAGSNLTVILGEPSASELSRVEAMSRKFLQKQFEETLAILRLHRAYLDRLIQALTERQFLLQSDLLALHASVSPTSTV